MTDAGSRRLVSTVTEAERGMRLDQWLHARLADLSRTRVKALVEEGRVQVDGHASKAAHRLHVGERVEAEMPAAPPPTLVAEPIALDVVFEDDEVLVVDKPAGMVTHPGAGQLTGTLAAAALFHAPGLGQVGSPRRPGIVHRLDKGTSGLIVLAKTQRAYDALTAQLARRTMTRAYLCLVHGDPRPAERAIDRPIARDPRSRVRMAVAAPGRGKRAVTRARVIERFGELALVECRLETGRTHQIRVHLASAGHPLLGDATYGAPLGRRLADPELGALVDRLGGIALHAVELAFAHPKSGEPCRFSSPLPHRIAAILSHLRGARS